MRFVDFASSTSRRSATSSRTVSAIPSDARSFIKVVMATVHPLPSPPMTASAGARTSLKKISLNSESPVICLRGRTSTPGRCMSSRKYVSPWSCDPTGILAITCPVIVLKT